MFQFELEKYVGFFQFGKIYWNIQTKGKVIQNVLVYLFLNVQFSTNLLKYEW